MTSLDDLTAFARSEAEALRDGMMWKPPDGRGSRAYWKLTQPQAESRVRARAEHALELLRDWAGQNSELAIHAADRLHHNNHSLATGVREVADILDRWADLAEAGLVQGPAVAQRPRSIAATDLMEQVRALLEDRRVHPAAPVMLAGAAIEEFLRGWCIAKGVELSGSGIDVYARALRSADQLSTQDMKDVVQIAGLRNAAAHGEFENITAERAGLMEQQVNLFIASHPLVTQEFVSEESPDGLG